MKKVKICTSILLTVILCLSFLGTSQGAGLLPPQRRLVLSAESFSEETIDVLQSKGITINEETIFEFELCNIENQNGLSSDVLVLKVFNEEDNVINADIIASIPVE